MTGKQDVLAILGSGERSAGKAVVEFVEDALRANREQIAQLTTEHNERVTAFEARVAEFVSVTDFEPVQRDVEAIKRGLLATAEALGGAVTAHNQAVDTPSTASVGTAQAAVADAAQAAQSDNRRIERLEERLDAIEAVVDNHEERISALERGPLTIAQPAPVPTPVAIPTAPAVEAVQPTQIQRIIQDANPRHWAVLAWVLAIIGLALGVMLGRWLQLTSEPVLDWFSWAALLIFGAVGFFGGGVIGTRLNTAPPEVRIQAQA